MKKKILALAVLLSSASYLFFVFYQPDSVATDNAYIHSDVTAISAEVSGVINKILVEDNQWVKKGQPLFSIDDKDYRASRQVALSARDVSKAAYQKSNALLEMQLVKIKQAEQAIVSTRANANLQSAELTRLSSLLADKSVSENRYDAQSSKAVEANATLQRTILALDAEKKSYQAMRAENTQLFAQVHQAEAKLQLADIALERTIIKAPVGGYIADRQAQVGKLVQPGMSLMIMVPEDLWIEANFKETQLKSVTAGQMVEIKLDMFPDRILRGQVSSITPATGSQFSLLPPQNATGNFVKVVQRVPVRIAFSIPEDLKKRVYAGLSAEVSINTTQQGSSS